MNDFLNEFADIQDFDPSLTVCPDSVHYFGQSRTIFGRTFTSRLKFTLISGDTFAVKCSGVCPNFDLTHADINGIPHEFEIGYNNFLISIDSFIRTPQGTAKYKYLFSENEGFSESLELSSPDVPITLSPTPSAGQNNIYDILASRQNFADTMAAMGFTTQKIVNPTFQSAYVTWKVRCRTAANSFYMGIEEQNVFYKPSMIVQPSSCSSTFYEKVTDQSAISSMSNIKNAIINN